MAKLRKNDIVEKVSNKVSMSKKDINNVVEAIEDIVINALKSGDDVNLSKLGTFKVVNRAARSGINPKTKEKINIPASKSAGFKANKSLKEILN